MHYQIRRITLTLSVIFFLVSFVSSTLANSEALAMVTGIYGRLKINKHTIAKMRDPIYKDDLLSTDSSSKATLLLKDGSEIKMAENTELTIKDDDAKKKEKKGILVTLGKIFAKMVKQRSNFQIISPHGAAAIEGTELQIEVKKDSSTLAVADGSVKFFNNKNSVKVATAFQVSSSSPTMPLKSPTSANLKQLLGWQKDILSYMDILLKFQSTVNNVRTIKAQSTAGSLLKAQTEMKDLQELLDRLNRMVPDSQFTLGHSKMKLGFSQLKQAVIFAIGDPNFSKFWSDGEASLSIAETELQKYKALYNQNIQQYLGPSAPLIP